MIKLFVTAENLDGELILENERVLMVDKIKVEKALNAQGKSTQKDLMYSQALYAFAVAKRLNKYAGNLESFLEILADAIVSTPEAEEELDADALE